MKHTHLLLFAGALATTTLADEASQLANPRIDFPAHVRTAAQVGKLRKLRRITEKQFLEMAADPATLILDARSAEKFRLRHIRGAVNLPFTDFTEEALARVIPTKTTRVLIYCSNNFDGDRVAFAEKAAPASLNISTFIALTTYGYRNVYELGPLIDLHTAVLPFEGTDTRSLTAAKRLEECREAE